MNERGTYGHPLNGYADLHSYGDPQLGADFPDTDLRRGFGKQLVFLLGGGLVGYFAARLADTPTNKGIALGLVGGGFMSALYEQRDELRRINQQLASRSV